MRPGKMLTPRPQLDLEKLWRSLDEDPPGPIRKVVPAPTPAARRTARGPAAS